LKIKQGKMADLLGVPPNTLSRWETGATVPDANSLATIYSIAKEYDLTPNFFGIRRESSDRQNIQKRLLVVWNFQTMCVPVTEVSEAAKWAKTELERRFGWISNRLYKAFIHPTRSAEGDILEELGWRVFEYDRDIDEEIIDQVKSDVGQDPAGTILVLISRESGFVELIDELRADKVRVYLIAPENTDSKLIGSVSQRRWIKWDRVIWNLPLLY